MARRGGLSDRDDLQRSLQELRDLMAAAIPRAFEPSLEWKPVATMFVARMRDMLGSVSMLMAARYESDALLVMRTIYEHTVMFCWLAANPEARLQEWIDHSERGRLVAFEEAQRLFDLAPPGDVDVDQRAELERLRPLDQLAKEADDHWSKELPAFRPVQKGPLGLVTLTGFYTAVYRHLSRAAHAEVETSDPVVRLTKTQLVVTSEERVGRMADDTLALAIPIASLALVVYAHQFPGVLDREAIHALNQSLGDRSEG